MRLNKYGNLGDVPFGIRLVFVFGFMGLVSLVILSAINTNMQASAEVTAVSKTFLTGYLTKSQWAIDYGFLMMLLGIIIFSLVQARRIPTSSEFFIFAIIYVIFTWAAAIGIGYFWTQIVAGDARMTTMATNIPITNFILTNILYVALIYTLLITVVLYTKEN